MRRLCIRLPHPDLFIYIAGFPAVSPNIQCKLLADLDRRDSWAKSLQVPCQSSDPVAVLLPENLEYSPQGHRTEAFVSKPFSSID